MVEFGTRIGDPADWDYGTISGEITASNGICGGTQNGPDHISAFSGGREIYAKALAYHLYDDDDFAAEVRTRLLDLTDTYGWGTGYSGANQCILNLSFGVPLLIASADLIEEYSGWTTSDKQAFQAWLAGQIYKRTAWASQVRNNNWGAAGAQASAMIADYLWDSTLSLNEVEPDALSFTNEEAYLRHNAFQLDRMNTNWQGDSQCSIFGIQSYGGIPDELRRGTTGCTGTYLLTTDNSYAYQMTHSEYLLAHAEFLLHRGNHSIYDNVAEDGSGSLLKALTFVFANPIQSFDWSSSRKGTLHVAYRYYRDSDIYGQLYTNESLAAASTIIPWGKLTHGFSSDEDPDDPAFVDPPGEDNVAPTDPGTPTTTSPTSDTTPTWTWTASTDADSGLGSPAYNLRWSLTNDFSSGVSTGTAASNTFTHISALTEGTWYFEVRARDAFNNLSNPVTGSVVIDGVSPTGTPVPSSSGGGNNNGGPQPLPGCAANPPENAPDLFQIDSTSTTAKLYFVTAKPPVDRYAILYGLNSEVNNYSTMFYYSGGPWVVSFTISDLQPNTEYFFQVYGLNDCRPGEKSAVKSVRTKGAERSTSSSISSSTSDISDETQTEDLTDEPVAIAVPTIRLNTSLPSEEDEFIPSPTIFPVQKETKIDLGTPSATIIDEIAQPVSRRRRLWLWVSSWFTINPD